jgi:hypothetical protein
MVSDMTQEREARPKRVFRRWKEDARTRMKLELDIVREVFNEATKIR